MTSGAGLFEEGLPADVEASRDEVGGVLSIGDLLSFKDSFLTAAILGMSLISTRSWSLSLDWPPPGFDELSSSEVIRHSPLGSMVTCSTDLGVDFKILSTYLRRLGQ